MHTLDWLILVLTLVGITGYGIYRSRNAYKTADGYLVAGRDSKWLAVCVGIMATQASAITFLSTPGQAYTDGMRFVQFYFGLPLAMIVLSLTAVPIFSKLKVFTAYQYLEGRFDGKTRLLAAFFFLLQRGLSTGITIYAPAIVLSTLLHLPLQLTILIIGMVVIIYTVLGGNKAVSVTHQLQMLIILGGMVLAGVLVFRKLPNDMGMSDVLTVAGNAGKLNIISTHFDLKDRYNLLSGIVGGFFLALSYFGTDQSQVARYLTGASVTESRMGLIFNALLKIPMQAGILFIGVLVFVFYQFNPPPVNFNPLVGPAVAQSAHLKPAYNALEAQHQRYFTEKQGYLSSGIITPVVAQRVRVLQDSMQATRVKAKAIVAKLPTHPEANDTDYIFISFIMTQMPTGVIGLLLAVMFCAAMSSTAAGLTALGTTTAIDVVYRGKAIDTKSVRATQFFTAAWGTAGIAFALFATRTENLIQAVNILGSLFYGSILGIFAVAFFIKRIQGTAVFIGAIVAEAVILTLFFTTDAIGYLWYNPIGCFVVIIVAYLAQQFNINTNKHVIAN